MKFMTDAFNREVRGWTTRSCGFTPAGGTPTCKVMTMAQHANRLRFSNAAARWTLERRTAGRKIGTVAPRKNNLKKIAVGQQPSHAGGSSGEVAAETAR